MLFFFLFGKGPSREICAQRLPSRSFWLCKWKAELGEALFVATWPWELYIIDFSWIYSKPYFIFYLTSAVKYLSMENGKFFPSVMGRSRKYVHNGSRPAFTGSAKLAYGNFCFLCLGTFISSEGSENRVLFNWDESCFRCSNITSKSGWEVTETQPPV